MTLTAIEKEKLLDALREIERPYFTGDIRVSVILNHAILEVMTLETDPVPAPVGKIEPVCQYEKQYAKKQEPTSELAAKLLGYNENVLKLLGDLNDRLAAIEEWRKGECGNIKTGLIP